MTERSELIGRIWERDPTVWTGADEAKWLGWLDEPRRMGERIAELNAFADSVAEENLDAVVLFGMGGSSLAPEVLRRTFGVESFHVLDTTHPEAIRNLERSIDLERTLFVSASKSGGTLETRSHTDYFWEKSGKKGSRFIAITDPGSELEHLAGERGFRHVFPGEPTIGGRYSALSPFGMVPAALMGIDVARLLANADRMADICRSDSGNPGYELGRQFGTGWREGRDKICIAETSGGFGLWAEQLIAESTGKQGKGLVPAPGESPDGPDRQAAAFIEPSDENDHRIADLVRKLRRRTGLVVTHGYGPRYLHSTGQLHKGGPNTGLFLQVVDDPGDELKIPGRPFGFRRLIRAQAAGDYASLKERGRRVARVHLEEI